MNQSIVSILDVEVCALVFIKEAWDHFWVWVDWHGRIATVALILVALGGAAIVRYVVVVFSSVSGAYLWIVSVLVFAVFLCTLSLAGSRLKPRQRGAGRAATGLAPLPPRVAPHGYGPYSGQDGWGLIVTNPGYAAFNIHIPSVTIGSSHYKLVFPLKMAQLLERDHKCFFAAWLEHPTLPGRSGKDLFEIMRTNNVDKFKLSIVYQDGDFHWYRSGCLVERDVGVTGGIVVSFVEQELIPEPTHESNIEAQPSFSVHSEVIKFRPPEHTDPMIYLRVINDDELFQQTKLVLHNSGKGVAHNVQIRELKIGHDSVTFSSLAILSADEKQSVLPVIEDGPFSKHNLLAVLHKDWNTSGGEFTQEYPFGISIDYEDVGHHEFRTLVSMMYYPVRESYARNHAHVSPRPRSIILEVKKIELRRLS